MARVLVTGATGMVGRYVVERLVHDGWTVRALVRDRRAADRASPVGQAFAESGVEPFVGNTLDATAVDRAARNCEAIVHAAAAITPAGGWEAFRQPNIEGTRNAIAAASRSGARLVHVSSVAVYGGTARYRDGERTDEDAAFAPLGEAEFYARSKRESEALVLDAHRAGRIWATAVRPDVIYGRYDRQFVPRLAKLLRYRLVPLIAGGQTRLAVVHAANVADGVVRALAYDAAGGRAYNLANDFDVSVAEFFRLAAIGLGLRIWTPSIPRPIAGVAINGLLKAASAMFGGQYDMVAAASLDFLTRDNPFSSDRAKRELGWAPAVRPETGIADAFRWSADHRGA